MQLLFYSFEVHQRVVVVLWVRVLHVLQVSNVTQGCVTRMLLMVQREFSNLAFTIFRSFRTVSCLIVLSVVACLLSVDYLTECTCLLFVFTST